MNEIDPSAVPEAVPTGEQAVPSGSQQQSTQQTQNTAALVLAIIAICLAVGLAVTAFFIWSQLQQMTGQQAGVGQQIDQRLQPLHNSLEQLSGAIENQYGTADRRFAAIEQREEKIRQEQQSLDQRLSGLAAVLGRSEQGWGLAEVEHLLATANQELLLQRDVGTARVALQMADARLRELADPHYLPVREQIVKDLEALELVPVVDVDGIFLVLGVWIERIAGLPVAGTSYMPEGDSEPGPSDDLTTAADWQQIPHLIWDALKELFSFREHDRPVKPMLPPEREYFLRENLSLQLSAARLGLLRDDNAQFQTALATSQQWLKEYFAADDALIIELHTKLGQLREIDIRPDLPDISGSLRSLRQQMKSADQAPVASSPSSARDSTARQAISVPDPEVAAP